MNPFPRSITSLHQIEITSRCNLRCIYCPSPAIVAGKYPNRQAVDMSRETYERALEWVAYFIRKGTQGELNLAGIGESTIHPEFIPFVRMARNVMGPTGRIVFATNGIECSEEMVSELSALGARVYVSLHRPEKAGLAIELYRKYGLLEGVSVDPSINANDWAGQVKWTNSGQRFPCPWMALGWVAVLADGRFSKCCIDAQGIGILGHVNDPVGAIFTEPYKLCQSCYQTIDPAHWNQKEGVPR